MSRTFFSWKDIKSFNVKETESEEYSKIIFDTTQKILPIYAIFLPKEIEEDVVAEITKVAEKSEIEEPHSIQLADKIGF